MTAPAPRNLLADIDAFLGDLASGAFYVEEDWDEYGQDVTGQDEWVEPMDDLFAEAKGGLEAAPAPLVPMARITITIPEELRFRLLENQ